MSHPIVLVTASSAVVARHISEALARYGFETLTASCEVEGLAILRANRRIGVVVADIAAGGLVLAREARQVQPKIGVVYTASAPHEIPRAAKVKDAPVVRAPYVAHQLAAVIAGLGRRVLAEPIAA